MLGLFTKAHLTQRSLFRSIYNILKVIFSLNKRLRDMTLFSLLFFSPPKWKNILGLQVETSHLKWLPVGFGEWVGEGGGKGAAPKKVAKDTNSKRDGEIADAQIRGHRQVASISSPPVTDSNTPLVGTLPFRCAPYFLATHDSASGNTSQLYPNRS